jgi:hypothetical protein
VSVLGGPFLEALSVYCRFGTYITLATYLNESAVQCEAPAGSGSVEVDVSQNGQQWTDSNVMFTYLGTSLRRITCTSDTTTRTPIASRVTTAQTSRDILRGQGSCS